MISRQGVARALRAGQTSMLAVSFSVEESAMFSVGNGPEEGLLGEPSGAQAGWNWEGDRAQVAVFLLFFSGLRV